MPFRPTDANLNQMRALWRVNQTLGEIAQYFNCTEMTVRNWIHRFQEEDPRHPAHDQRRENRRPFALSNDDIEEVREALEENPFLSVRSLPEVLDLDVSYQTLRRTIKRRLGMHHRRPARKAIIVNPDYETRLAYANEHRFRTADEWRRTVAVDEKVFSTAKDGKLSLYII